jgi:hypothetical protein
MAFRGGMTRSSIVAAIVVTLLLALLIWWRDERTSVERSTEALHPPSSAVHRSTGEVAAVPTARPVSPPSVVPPAVSPAAVSPAGGRRPYQPPPMTEAMRERRRRVLDAPGARAPAAPTSASGEAPGTMADRTGKLGPEVKALNQQLMPLVGQCFDQAKERGVRGNGMLALGVKLAGAEGIGRIIESVEPTANNAIGDPELIDCVRQSAFTVDLPPPTSDGASDIMLTMPFEGAPDAGVPSSR